jgi:tetratricopeptide (TPR) repeat protein
MRHSSAEVRTVRSSRKPLARGALSIFLSGILLIGPTALATAQGDDGSAEQARGMAAFGAGRYEAAVSALESAYRLNRTPQTLYQIALAYAAMGQPAKALESYQSFVNVADSQKDAVNLAAAKSEIVRINREVGHFAVRVSPSNANIQIDGHAAAILNSEIWMLPGKHTIEIRAPGYDSYKQTLDVQTGRYSLEINLRQPNSPPSELAAALVDEGIMLKTQGDAAGALSRFEEAQQIYATPRGSAQQGLAEEALGDMAAAEDHVSAAIAAKKDPWVRKNRTLLRKAQTRIMRFTKNYAKLQVAGTPTGTRLYLHERQVGSLPQTTLLRVPAGPITLIARQDGFAESVFEADLPPRSLRVIDIKLEPLPPPPPPPPPPPAPLPPPVVVPVEEAPPPPAPEQPKPASQSDIEALLREQGKLPEDNRAATGFELNVSAGYQVWLGDKLFGSRGAPALHVSLGARIPWPLSFGLTLIDMSTDFGRPETNAVVTVSPGFYLRGHTQPKRKRLALDIWGGAAISPIAFSIASFDSGATTAQRLAGTMNADQVRSAVVRQLGIGQVVTRQSVNVPLELGATFYVTRGVGVSLSTAFTFWIPTQLCYHDGSDRYCVSSGLKTQHSLFVGAGLSFLP